ncbi:MAG: CAP domain-containing protein [Verrucomicrobiota bacterium]|nr:CAP domain-containing protein [Verrucomicrobiota bacterium]
MKKIIIYLLISCGITLCLHAQTLRSQPSHGPTAEEILPLINQERKTRNLCPLELESKLAEFAQAWAKHMAKEDKMSHRSASDLMNFIEKNQMNNLTENVAYTTEQWSAEDIVAIWMKSDGHRANLLKKDSTICGIGTASNGKRSYAVFNGARHDVVTKGN